MTTTFLDLHSGVLQQVLRLLPASDLCRLGATCTHFGNAVFRGLFAATAWQAFCKDALEHGQYLLQARAAREAEDAAYFWRALFCQTKVLNAMHWCSQNSRLLLASADQAPVQRHKAAAGSSQNYAAPFPVVSHSVPLTSTNPSSLPGARAGLQAVLARTGHTATVAGRFLVVAGGITRDSSPHTHVLLVDLQQMRFVQPAICGQVPAARFRHSAVHVTAQPASALHRAVADGLASSPASRASFLLGQGHLLLLSGGYDTQGKEFGGPDLEAIWVHEDASALAWAHLTATGSSPSCRHHHSGDLYAGGSKYLVYGGEGQQALADANATADGQGPPVVYVLDVQSLAWQRHQTFSSSSGQHPGLRALHITAVRQTAGGPELVVAGGYCDGVLAEMQLFALNLSTWRWAWYPGLSTSPGCPAQLPTPCQRVGTLRLTQDWLLMLGGCPEQGEFLEDVHRLHLPTLTWRGPPQQLTGQAAQGVGRVAGHTLTAGLAFGGCIATVVGIVPISKMDVLLLGVPPKTSAARGRLLQAAASDMPSCSSDPVVRFDPAMPGRLAAVEAPQAPGSSRQMPPVPLRIGDLIASESDARLIRQWMMDPTTGPFPAGGSLFGRCSGGQESTPARSCSSGSAGEDGAEQYSPGPSLDEDDSLLLDECSSVWTTQSQESLPHTVGTTSLRPGSHAPDAFVLPASTSPPTLGSPGTGPSSVSADEAVDQAVPYSQTFVLTPSMLGMAQAGGYHPLFAQDGGGLIRGSPSPGADAFAVPTSRQGPSLNLPAAKHPRLEEEADPAQPQSQPQSHAPGPLLAVGGGPPASSRDRRVLPCDHAISPGFVGSSRQGGEREQAGPNQQPQQPHQQQQQQPGVAPDPSTAAHGPSGGQPGTYWQDPMLGRMRCSPQEWPLQDRLNEIIAATAALRTAARPEQEDPPCRMQ